MTLGLILRIAMVLGVIALLWPVPHLLSSSRWPTRRPRLGAAVWVIYALGTAAALLLTLALSAGSLIVAGLLLAWMLGRLAHTVLSLSRLRRRHQDALALVSVYDPVLNIHVVDDDRALAYCLPSGPEPMVVVTRGCLEIADDAELSAILAHERSHARNRHHVLITGFVAWQRILPFVPSSRAAARAVGAVTEAWADDCAAREISPAVTLRAIVRLGSGMPGGVDALGWEPDAETLERVRRLLDRLPDRRRFAGGI